MVMGKTGFQFACKWLPISLIGNHLHVNGYLGNHLHVNGYLSNHLHVNGYLSYHLHLNGYLRGVNVTYKVKMVTYKIYYQWLPITFVTTGYCHLWRPKFIECIHGTHFTHKTCT